MSKIKSFLKCLFKELNFDDRKWMPVNSQGLVEFDKWDRKKNGEENRLLTAPPVRKFSRKRISGRFCRDIYHYFSVAKEVQ